MMRNQVPTDEVVANPLLATLVDAGSDEVVVRDVGGRFHFNADFKNSSDLAGSLDRLAGSAHGDLVATSRGATLDLFEHVFNHHEFTGRSATMYAYEGIGSVYWHMVAKLLLAVQEVILDAPAETDEASLRELKVLYGRIRDGLGFNKTPAQYGAFPTDPYSHTPAHAGAQQPGMTGQVKEELLARWAELGLIIDGGSIRFETALLDARELRLEPGEMRYLDVALRPQRLTVDRGVAAFTICQVPVVIHVGDEQPVIRVTDADGGEREVVGSVLDRDTSRQIFDRSGHIVRLDVHVRSVLDRIGNLES
jgi:hypothetical protein